MKVLVIVLIICILYMTGSALDSEVEDNDLDEVNIVKDSTDIMERGAIPKIKISLEATISKANDSYTIRLLLRDAVNDFRAKNQLPPLLYFRDLDAIYAKIVDNIKQSLKGLINRIRKAKNSGQEPSKDDIQQFNTFYDDLADTYPTRFSGLKIELVEYANVSAQQEIMKEQIIKLFNDIKNTIKTLKSYLKTIKLTDDEIKMIKDRIKFNINIYDQVKSYLTGSSFFSVVNDNDLLNDDILENLIDSMERSSVPEITLSQEALNVKANDTYTALITLISYMNTTYRYINQLPPTNILRLFDAVYGKFVPDIKFAINGLVMRIAEAMNCGEAASNDDIQQFNTFYDYLAETYPSRFNELKIEQGEYANSPIQQVIIREQLIILLKDIKDTIKTLKSYLETIKLTDDEIRMIKERITFNVNIYEEVKKYLGLKF